MRTRTTTLLVAAALAAPLAGGCVTSGTFDKKVAELEQLRKDSAQREHDLDGKLKAEQAKVADLTKQLDDTNAKLAQTTGERDTLRKQLDEGTALVGELKGKLEKLGQNVDKLTADKGQLAAGLADAKTRLEELRKQKAAAEERAAAFNNLVVKLRSMVDAGQLKVLIREGRMLIALPSDVLFDSGKTTLKPEGQAALAQVAQVLATIPDRHFLVAGHTDDVPIHSAKFPSNWELSTARAVEVTRLLVASGMKPQVLAAAGYGEFDPVVANDSTEHKAQNRRIEIVLQPNLQDLPSLDGISSK